MSSAAAADGSVSSVLTHSPAHEKTFEQEKHLEYTVTSSSANLVYDHDDEEPELHTRTYIALAAMFVLNLVQVMALQGPPTVVCNNRCADWPAGLD